MRKFRQIVARTANGVRQTYEYDGRGQLLAVKENGVDVERYSYDKAGNMLKKTVRGKTTTFAFDGANQLVSSTTDGKTIRYAYDAAGRLVKEGDKTYRYGYLDKVLSVTEGERTYTYDYHVDGQLARADYGKAGDSAGRTGCPQPAGSEDFLWDGLALIRRGDERFVNEPHVGNAPKKLRFVGKPRAQRSARRARKGPRGNPVASSKGTTYFNDMLGTTVGAKKGAKYTAAALTAFGEGGSRHAFFTGKPQVDGLGHAFLMRNYRASFGKWQTADPLGYLDGWNGLAYCRNAALISIDFLGAFMLGCYDLNGGETPTLVLSAGEMVTGNQLRSGGDTEDSYGEFFCDIKSISRDNGMVLIKLELAINVIASKHDIDFKPNERSKFLEHASESNDSYMKNPVYEAVEAHERGHADAFFNQWRMLFSAALQNCNIDDPSLSMTEVSRLVLNAYKETWAVHIAYSGLRANEQTIGWFEGNPAWERMPDEIAKNGDILHVWKKKE